MTQNTKEKEIEGPLSSLANTENVSSSSMEQKIINHWSFPKDVYFVFKMYVSKVLLNMRIRNENNNFRKCKRKLFKLFQIVFCCVMLLLIFV